MRAERRTAFTQLEPADFRNLCECHRAADGMAEKGAGVNRLAGGGGPCCVHQISAANTGGKREAAGERLAETDQVGNHAGVFASEPFSSATKASINLVKDQQRVVFVAKPAEQRQKFF